MGSISLGIALVAGKKRVPYPATGNRHLRIETFAVMNNNPYVLLGGINQRLLNHTH
jgi:hypothetical protein